MEENVQYYCVCNGLYYVKRTDNDIFYRLNENYEWEYDSSLSDEFYDVLSGYVEITKDVMEQYINENKGFSR